MRACRSRLLEIQFSGSYEGVQDSVIKRCILVFCGALALSLAAVGCASSGSASRHRIVVCDASTKQPVAGAQVELAWSGARQYFWTDAQGVASFNKQASFLGLLGPRMERVDVKMPGYEPSSLQLSGTIPHEIQITPIHGQK